MKDVTSSAARGLLTRTLPAILGQKKDLFIKLVEEVGEVAEVLNGRSGTESGCPRFKRGIG